MSTAEDELERQVNTFVDTRFRVVGTVEQNPTLSRWTRARRVQVKQYRRRNEAAEAHCRAHKGEGRHSAPPFACSILQNEAQT
jgi:hypothetical protein